MDPNVEVALINGTVLEGIRRIPEINGEFLADVHVSSLTDATGQNIPLAKMVFIPYTAILYIILEQ